MNWKLFTIASINLVCLLFPYNILGCAGGDEDPYDYYTGFFHPKTSGDKDFEPFYYTNVQFLYQQEEPVDIARLTSAEWSSFAQNKFTREEAYDFVCGYASKDLTSLYNSIEKQKPLSIPDSVKKNGMTKYLIEGKNLEALGYLLYARKLEPFVTGSWNSWETPQKDSAKMAAYIRNGQQLLAVAKDPFIQLRYAYQITRLAHYSGRYQDCLNWYDQLVQPNPTKSILQELSLGLKAGALLRTGHADQAAYLFSQLFAAGKAKRISNYMSFDWSTKRFDAANRKASLSLCKTNSEKANMLGLFVLGSNTQELKAIQQIAQLDAKADLLPVLITREVNKLEENVLTPSLRFRGGSQSVTIQYREINKTDKAYQDWIDEAKQMAAWLPGLKGNGQEGFYKLAAAHTSLIAEDFDKARTYLTQSRDLLSDPLQKDQWKMTSLLVAINSRTAIDNNFEKELMPSIDWLTVRAKKDPEFARFKRRLFADVLAIKYKAANDMTKYYLCRAVADSIQKASLADSYGYFPETLYDLKTTASGSDIEKLIRFTESASLNPFEQYLVKQADFKQPDLYDLAGTSCLRLYSFAEAEKWFKKLPANFYAREPYTTYLAANPFADLILDTHQPTKQDTVKYTKLSFTQKMIRLEKSLATAIDKERKAQICYELAKGYYHITYWGNSWMMVEYRWSVFDNEATEKPAGRNYSEDYFKAQKAKTYYLQALSLTGDRNLQAKCIFMAAKCDQKQVSPPPVMYEDNASYRTELNIWLKNFDARNAYFTQLQKNFSNTPFYKEAFNTCSYLKDFVTRKRP